MTRGAGRFGLILGALALAAISGGCASSGAVGAGPVPKPFPMPPSPREGGPADAGRPAGAGDPSVPENSRTTRPVPPRPGVADSYALVGTALDLRGAPYRDGGADPRGFDCSGFTQYVFGQHGVALPRSTRDQFKVGRAVTPAELAAGDLLFFTTTSPGASHVGISVGTDQFVHAPSSAGVVRVERLSSDYWSLRFIGARRIDAESQP